jgi:hypothetical protein
MFLLISGPVLAAGPALAQNDQENLQGTLARSMARQAPLSDDDIRTYLRYVEPIYRLRFEPDRQNELIRTINIWDENRFAYVTTKMAVGMSLLMRPSDARNNAIPDFARPSRTELELIKSHQDELAQHMDSLQAKYAAGSSS